MSAAEDFKARLFAIYALSVYLPMSRVAAVIRSISRRFRGKQVPDTSRAPIETIQWWQAVPRSVIRLVETEKSVCRNLQFWRKPPRAARLAVTSWKLVPSTAARRSTWR